MAGSILEMPAKNRVFQRNESNVAAIVFKTDARVKARVLAGKRIIKPWHMSTGSIPGIPAGGPYTLEVELRGGGVKSATGLLVGDLWVMAGQSNMDGCAKLVDLEPPSRMVHAFYHDDAWGVAKDPLCRVLDSRDPVHWPAPDADIEALRAQDRAFREYGGSIGVRFGKEICKIAGVPVGLLVCSHGGTSMEQWDPQKKSEGGASLYGSMLRRVNACGGKVAGVIWYQGESDANPEAARLYKDRMKALVAAMRSDFGSPRLPFLYVQIGRFFMDEIANSPVSWNQIQQAQLELASEIDNVAMAAAIDSTMSDVIHNDSISCRRLGVRLAELARALAYEKRGALGLAPDKVRFEDDARMEVRITYKNVRGKLAPSSHVWGFFVEDADGTRVPLVSAKANGSKVFLRLAHSVQSGARLWYGRGFSPATNLRDKSFAAPVFGPVSIG